MHPYGFVNELTDQARRRSRLVGLLRFGIVVLGLAPLVIAWRVKTTHRAPPLAVDPPMSSVSSTVQAPWGLFVSTHAVHTWIGPLPVAAPRADAQSGPLSPDSIQSEIASHAGGKIRECYASTAAHAEDVAGTAGVLVASVLVRRDGTNEVGVGGDSRLVNAGVGTCVSAAMSGVHFGKPKNDTEWFHFPIRFVADPPKS